MKNTLIILILLISVLTAQTLPDTTMVDSTKKVAVSKNLPANFNDYLGTATDTTIVVLELALTREPTPACEIKNYLSFEVAKRVRLQDRWKNSNGAVRYEYYTLVDSQWAKLNPRSIFRQTPPLK